MESDAGEGNQMSGNICGRKQIGRRAINTLGLNQDSKREYNQREIIFIVKLNIGLRSADFLIRSQLAKGRNCFQNITDPNDICNLLKCPFFLNV